MESLPYLRGDDVPKKEQKGVIFEIFFFERKGGLKKKKRNTVKRGQCQPDFFGCAE